MQKRMSMSSAFLVSTLFASAAAAQTTPSLGELASKSRSKAASPTQATPAPTNTPTNADDAGRVDKVATLLSTSTLEWTKTSDATWVTKYVGNNLADITVTLSVVQDIAVVQSIVAPKVKLDGDQLVALLKA